jgi:hypothetical protein
MGGRFVGGRRKGGSVLFGRGRERESWAVLLLGALGLQSFHHPRASAVAGEWHDELGR